MRSDATDSASGALTFSGGLAITNGPGTIAGATFANGWLRIGTSTLGITFDSNELYFAGAGNIGALSGGSITFTARPAFNGGTSGSTSPFTVDSTSVVGNLNADLLDGVQGSQFLRSDAGDTFDGTTSGRFLRFQCVSGRTANTKPGINFLWKSFRQLSILMQQ